MGTGIDRPLRFFSAAAALLLVLLTATGRAAAEGEQVVLMAPLIAPATVEEWIPPLVDQLLEGKLLALEGLTVVGRESRNESLATLAGATEIGTAELVEATRRAGADFAVVGQFKLDEDTLNVDLRLFSAEAQEQIASFQRPAPAAELFSVLSEAAAFVAAGVGVELGKKEKALLDRWPTESLRAHHIFLSARAEDDPARYLTLLKEALEIDPDYVDANLRLGLELYNRGRVEEALTHMERAVSVGDDLPEAHNNLAVMYADQGRQEEALKEFRKALDLNPDYREARLNYGRLLEEGGRFDQAEKEYVDLLEADGNNVKARSSLALLYERTGRTELAIQEFRVLSRETPELAENYFLERGKEARKAKQYPTAEKFFLRAVDINPQLSEGYAELGTNSYLAGNFERSMKYFRQALALEPQKAEYHHYLGLALGKSGRPGEARKVFERSAELGGPLETRVSLAKVYLEAGEVTRAIDELNLVLDEDPSLQEAKELLARTMDRAETDQRKAKERSEFATHRLDRLESIIEDLNSTNRDLENRVLTQQRDRDEILRELHQLRSDRDRREEQFEQRMSEAVASMEQLSKNNEELERLRGEYAARVGDLEGELETAGGEVGKYQAVIDDLEARLVAVELESYQRVEEARAQAAAEAEARSEERVADLEQRLAVADKARQALAQVRLELAQQSMELGRIHLRNRSWDAASRHFLKTLEVDPGNSEAYYSLGEIYFQLGRFDLSKEMYGKAKELSSR